MSLLVQRAAQLITRNVLPLVATNRCRYSVNADIIGEGDEVLVERLEGPQKGITVLGLNRPAAKNSFSRGLVNTFSDILQDLQRDNGSLVVVLRSLTPGVFCAGADLKERQGRGCSSVVERSLCM